MHSLKQLINESTSRHCSFYLASNGKWYLELASREYGEREDADTFGPFSTMDKAVDYLDQFSNPGGWDEDDSGKRPPPTKSPNGRPVQSPGGGGGGSMWGGGGFSSSARDYFMSPGRDSSSRSTKLTDQQLKDRISDIIHDHGDEYGWDSKPSVDNVVDDLADQTRKDGWTYDSALARKYAEQALGVKPRAAAVPASAPKPAAKPAAAPAKPAAAPVKGGKKTTYKIYNGTGTGKAVTGSSPIHTRIKGKVYAPTAVSKFKSGGAASVEPEGDDLKVTDPSTGHTQRWTRRESLERLLHDFIELL